MITKILYLLSLLLIFFSLNLKAQITVDNSQTPTSLVQNVLLGNGVLVSNVTFSGDANQIGAFSGTSNLGINEGIILATGDIGVAVGPNDETSASYGGGFMGDADLSALSGGTTYDAAVLEFDFIPASDTISFSYVFGGEEYPEYVCSEFNDIFAFFLSGPNPAGGNYANENIAIIPGTNIPVAINSINSGVPGFNSMQGGCISLAYSSLYVDNTGGTTIQYDGFTTVLEASALVTACETYHIKIAIADLSDQAFDGGVFLQAKSFSSPSINISAIGSSFDSTMVEGCGAATYIFTRGGNLSQPLTIDYLIDGTAINGTDYTDLAGNPIANNISFAAGEDSAFLYINPVNDVISENTETIILSIPQVISCITDTLSATIYITNVDPMKIELSGDTVICTDNGESTTLSVNFTGGYGPFNFLWNNGLGSSQQVIVSPEEPTIYTVSIEDSCGNESAEKSIQVINECAIVTTNIVTPNGDGKNDFFTFKYLEAYPNSKLIVYNRWGSIVYKNDSYNNDWSPDNLSEGTYYYILQRSDGVNHPAKEYHGTMTLLKN